MNTLDKFPVDIPVLSTDLRGIAPEQSRKTQVVIGFMPFHVFTNCVKLSWDKKSERGAKYRSYLSKTRVSAMTKIMENVQLPITLPIFLSCDPEANISVSEGQMQVQSTSLFFVLGGHDQVAATMNNTSKTELTIPFVCLIEPLDELERSLFIMSMRQPGRVADDLWRVSQSSSDQGDFPQLDDSCRLQYRDDRSPQHSSEFPERIIAEMGHYPSATPHPTKDGIDSYTNVVVYLNRESEPWKGRIKMLGESHNAEHIITQATMERSLVPFSSSRKGWRPSSSKELAEVLNEYWLGLASIDDLSEVFSAPRNHILQKGLGVSVMHSLLVELYPWRSLAGMSEKPGSANSPGCLNCR